MSFHSPSHPFPVSLLVIWFAVDNKTEEKETRRRFKYDCDWYFLWQSKKPLFFLSFSCPVALFVTDRSNNDMNNDIDSHRSHFQLHWRRTKGKKLDTDFSGHDIDRKRGRVKRSEDPDKLEVKRKRNRGKTGKDWVRVSVSSGFPLFSEGNTQVCKLNPGSCSLFSKTAVFAILTLVSFSFSLPFIPGSGHFFLVCSGCWRRKLRKHSRNDSLSCALFIQKTVNAVHACVSLLLALSLLVEPQYTFSVYSLYPLPLFVKSKKYKRKEKREAGDERKEGWFWSKLENENPWSQPMSLEQGMYTWQTMKGGKQGRKRERERASERGMRDKFISLRDCKNFAASFSSDERKGRKNTFLSFHFLLCIFLSPALYFSFSRFQPLSLLPMLMTQVFSWSEKRPTKEVEEEEEEWPTKVVIMIIIMMMVMTILQRVIQTTRHFQADWEEKRVSDRQRYSFPFSLCLRMFDSWSWCWWWNEGKEKGSRWWSRFNPLFYSSLGSSSSLSFTFNTLANGFRWKKDTQLTKHTKRKEEYRQGNRLQERRYTLQRKDSYSVWSLLFSCLSFPFHGPLWYLYLCFQRRIHFSLSSLLPGKVHSKCDWINLQGRGREERQAVMDSVVNSFFCGKKVKEETRFHFYLLLYSL